MKVSIIIPVYNCERFITQTLDCIYAQTLPRRDMEIIVCLDAPTDNTGRVVRAWARSHRGITTRVLENKTNRGVSFARNMAVRHATGEFVHFMDADDLINTDFYRALYAGAVETGADVAVASYRHQRRPNCSVVFDTATIISNPQDKIDITRVDQHGMMWRYLIRREFWNRNKFTFPEDMKICEDWVLANRVVFAANYIALAPGAMYLYRSREGSLISVGNRQREGGADGKRANLEMAQFLNENGLRKSIKQAAVFDFRLFGAIRLFTIVEFDNIREYRLFGRVLIARITTSYKMFRKPVECK